MEGLFLVALRTGVYNPCLPRASKLNRAIDEKIQASAYSKRCREKCSAREETRRQKGGESLLSLGGSGPNLPFT